MSMAHLQPAKSNNMFVALVTIGVVFASLLELLVVYVSGGYATRSFYSSRWNNHLQQAQLRAQAQAEAMRNARQVANRPAPTPWTPPTPSQPSPRPSWPSTSPPDVSPPQNSSTPPDGPGEPYAVLSLVRVNDRVHIRWGSSWWPGTVIEKRGPSVRIHYDNHADSSDEDVGLDRLRKMDPSDPKYRDPAKPAAASSTNTADLNPSGHRAPYNSRHQPQDYVIRDWRNRNGDVIFRGQLYANFGPAVRLILRSGFTTTSIPVDTALLSDSDQAYVRGFPVLSPDRPDPDPAADPRAEMERRRQEMMDRINERRNGGSKSPSTSPPVNTDSIKGMRTWKDATGKFDLQAELIAVENGNVKLQRPDGKIVTMPIDKLSEADRAAVRAKYPNE